MLIIDSVKGTLMTKQENFTVKGAVLLVDDDPLFCTITEAVLEHLGFPVLVAVGGNDEAFAMKGDYKELPQAFLHKPYTRDGLRNLLNRVLVDATNRTAETLADNEKISAMI